SPAALAPEKGQRGQRGQFTQALLGTQLMDKFGKAWRFYPLYLSLCSTSDSTDSGNSIKGDFSDTESSSDTTTSSQTSADQSETVTSSSTNTSATSSTSSGNSINGDY